MSTFDKVKEFLVRIVKDDEFRTSVAAQKNPENRSQLLQESGYTFTPSEFDSASIKILELAEQGLFTDLNDNELVAVIREAFFSLFMVSQFHLLLKFQISFVLFILCQSRPIVKYKV